MRYIGKRNGLIVEAIQWVGNNLPESWELLKEYREHIGYVGLNFDFMNELPHNLDRYTDCTLRLTKRGEGETHAVFCGGWVLKTISPEAGNYLFLENETFSDQFVQVSEQGTPLVLNPTGIQVKLSDDSFAAKCFDVHLAEKKAANDRYIEAQTDQPCQEVTDAKISYDLMTAGSPAIPLGVNVHSDIPKFGPNFQDVLLFRNKLKAAGLLVGDILKRTFDPCADVRLVAAVTLHKRNISLGNGTCHFLDLWELLGDMLERNVFSEFRKLGTSPKTFAKINDLPTPFLQFIVKFAVLVEADIPKEILSVRKKQILHLGKLLYKVRVKPHTTDPVLPLQYTKANFAAIDSFLLMLARTWRP